MTASVIFTSKLSYLVRWRAIEMNARHLYIMGKGRRLPRRHSRSLPCTDCKSASCRRGLLRKLLSRVWVHKLDQCMFPNAEFSLCPHWHRMRLDRSRAFHRALRRRPARTYCTPALARPKSSKKEKLPRELKDRD